MASKAQQVGIWIIAIVMTVGTIGGFFAIVLANQNQATQQTKQAADTQAQLEAYQQQAKDAAAQNEVLDGYTVTPFDTATATELKVEVLQQGDGATVAATDSISASYTGWLADGTIFDSTNKKDADDTPATFGLNQVIEGWTTGLTGQKVGSVVKLTIPAAQAYGSSEVSIIPANSPLQFIVKINSIEAATTES